MCEKDEEQQMVDDAVKKIAGEIGGMLEGLHETMRVALRPLTDEVDRIIRGRITDEKQIERLLDSLFNYTIPDEGLAEFKRLCRYAYPICPALVTDYVLFYKDLNTPLPEDDE